MGISEKDIRDNEDKYKKLLYDRIGKIISNQSEIVTQIGKTGQFIDIDTDMPNMGITFNNKLNELSHKFREAGISLFTEVNEKYNLVHSNFVGDAIIQDMILQLSNGTKALSEYSCSIEEATKKRSEKVKAVEESGPIKKLFLKIRSFFVPTSVRDLTSYSEEELREVNSHLSEYKEIDENLWKYNLRDNVVQSIVKSINYSQYADYTISGLLEEAVIPTLQKLGLEDVIPQLQEELSKQQEQSITSNRKCWELSPTQRVRQEILQERVAREFKTNTENKMDNQDKEYVE